MKELTLKLDHLFGIDEEFELYMKDFNGIEDVKYDKDTLDVYVKYDESKIGINRIKLEVLFFLGLNTMPSIRAFDKHSKVKLNNIDITIEYVCCEYCFCGMIDELLYVDGIEIVESDFDSTSTNNVHIYISYDENLINEEKIRELEKNMNEY